MVAMTRGNSGGGERASKESSAPKGKGPGKKAAELMSELRTPRKRRKRSEQVAMEIVREIVSQDLGCGDKLPQEGEMIKRYGVSRSSLREALRMLEVQGLISIRTGPGSGTEVGSVNPSSLSGVLALYLQMARADLGQLLFAWRAVEPLLARLAAISADRTRIEELMRPFASDADEHSSELAVGLAFHDCVADLVDNQVLTLILGAVGFLVTEQLRIGVPEFQLSERTIHDHARIADLILAGDGPGAENAMADHLDAVAEEISAVMNTRSREILSK